MGNFATKTDPLEQLKKHFKLEMKGNSECYFEGARSMFKIISSFVTLLTYNFKLGSFNDDVHSKFQEWLMRNRYGCVFSEDYIAGTFKYNIKRN